MQDNRITVTSSAAKHLKKTLEANPEALGIRFGVKKSGCSGLSYIIDFAKEVKSEDQVFKEEGVDIIVDGDSLPYLEGTEIDCVQEGLNEYLKFRNPKAENECGCGESFNIKSAEE